MIVLKNIQLELLILHAYLHAALELNIETPPPCFRDLESTL